MKNLILAVLLIALGVVILLEFRYELVVHSPVVAKIDRWTGDVWIVNAGVWRKILPAPKEGTQSSSEAITSQSSRRAK